MREAEAQSMRGTLVRMYKQIGSIIYIYMHGIIRENLFLIEIT